jgi:hypothetical protein
MTPMPSDADAPPPPRAARPAPAVRTADAHPRREAQQRVLTSILCDAYPHAQHDGSRRAVALDDADDAALAAADDAVLREMVRATAAHEAERAQTRYEQRNERLFAHFDHKAAARLRLELRTELRADKADSVAEAQQLEALRLRAQVPPPPRLAAAQKEVGRLEARLRRQTVALQHLAAPAAVSHRSERRDSPARGARVSSISCGGGARAGAGARR